MLQNQPLQNQLLLSISEFARHLGVGTATIRRWEQEGKLQGVIRTIGNQRRIPITEVTRILNLPRPKPEPYLDPDEHGLGREDRPSEPIMYDAELEDLFEEFDDFDEA